MEDDSVQSHTFEIDDEGYHRNEDYIKWGKCTDKRAMFRIGLEPLS